MFKVLSWVQINNMSHFLETEIQFVTLMAKHKCPVMVIRELQRGETTNIPEKVGNDINTSKIPRNRLS